MIQLVDPVFRGQWAAVLGVGRVVPKLKCARGAQCGGWAVSPTVCGSAGLYKSLVGSTGTYFVIVLLGAMYSTLD